MKTKYALIWQKLLGLPALLLFVAFLFSGDVFAQERASDNGIFNNNIENYGVLPCGTLDAGTIHGTTQRFYNGGANTMPNRDYNYRTMGNILFIYPWAPCADTPITFQWQVNYNTSTGDNTNTPNINEATGVVYDPNGAVVPGITWAWPGKYPTTDTWQDIAGATGVDYDPPALTTFPTGIVWYRRVASYNCTVEIESATNPSVPVGIVYQAPAFDCTTNDITTPFGALCAVGPVNINGTAIYPCPNTEATYRWEVLVGETWTVLEGQTGRNLFNYNITETTTFRRSIMQADGTWCYSNELTVTLGTPPPAATVAGPTPMCFTTPTTNGTYYVTNLDVLPVTGYEFYWRVDPAYGTFTGGQTDPTVNITWTRPTVTTPVNSWVEVVVTDITTRCQTVTRYPVVLVQQRVNTITAPSYVCAVPTYSTAGALTRSVWSVPVSVNAAAGTGTWSAMGPCAAASAAVQFVVPVAGKTFNPADPTTYTVDNTKPTGSYMIVVDNTVPDLVGGIYTIYWNDNASVCPANDGHSVTLYEPLLTNAQIVPTLECGALTATLTGPAAPIYTECLDAGMTAPATSVLWTVTPATGVTFGTNTANVTTVTVPAYGTYTFTYKVENGDCDFTFTKEVRFCPAPVADAGDDVVVCGTWTNTAKNSLSAKLAANVADGCNQGTWKVIEHPQGCTLPSFSNVNDPAATLFASGFGTYTLVWEVGYPGCLVTDTVNVTFYPGLTDVYLNPPTVKNCCMCIDLTYGAKFDLGAITCNPNALEYSLNGLVTVERQTGVTTAGAPVYTPYEAFTVITPATGYTVQGDSILLTTVTAAGQAGALKLGLSDYGRYRVSYIAQVVDSTGAVVAGASCTQKRVSIIETYAAPVADIVNMPATYSVCGLNDTITLTGTTPPVFPTDYPAKWNTFTTAWTVVDATGKPVTADMVYVGPTGAVTLRTAGVTQGTYTFRYTITNVNNPECISYDEVKITFLEAPDAGDGGLLELCGILAPQEAGCIGWDREIVYEGVLTPIGSNLDSPNINGRWFLSSVHDSTTMADINAMLAAGTDPANIVITFPNQEDYIFGFVATSTVANGCPADTAYYTISFDNSPMPRNIRPLLVDETTMKVLADQTDAVNFDNCFACPGTEQWYIIERPWTENPPQFETWFYEYTATPGFKSTTAPNYKVTWHSPTLDFGTTVDNPKNLAIEGGTLLSAYALGTDGVSLTQNQGAAGHYHIIKVRWDADATVGILSMREEYTPTRCYIDNEYHFNMINAVTIQGPVAVAAYATNQMYFVPVIPGAVYNWNVTGDLVDNTVYTGRDTIINGVNYNYILVNWGSLATNGVVTVDIPGICGTVAPLNVAISTTSLVGSVKYFNQYETPMPSPYGTSCIECEPNGQFMVALFDAVTKTQVGTAKPLYSATGNKFEFGGLDATKCYELRVWEQTANNVLGNAWTFQKWGGVSAADALLISYMAAQNADILNPAYPWILPAKTDAFTLSPFIVKVGDIDMNTLISGGDALNVMNRITNPIAYNPWPTGKWNFVVGGAKMASVDAKRYPTAPDYIFNENTITAYNAATPADQAYYYTTICDLKPGVNPFNVYYIATGDVNASYIPQAAQQRSADLGLNYRDVQNVEVGKSVNIPVRIDHSADVSAFTLGLKFDNSLLKINSVEGYAINMIDNKNGIVNIGWMQEGTSKRFSANDNVVMINATVLGTINEGIKFFELTDVTEFVDGSATPISVNLSTNSLKVGDANLATSFEVKAYPNPFRTNATISYTNIEGKATVQLFNKAGQLVKSYVGNNGKVDLNGMELSGAGSYTYRVILEGADGNVYTGNGTLILVK